MVRESVEMEDNIRSLPGKERNISLVAVEDNIINFGLRRIASFLRSRGHNVKLIFLPTVNFLSVRQRLFPTIGKQCDDDISFELAELVKDSELIGFSSMTNYAAKTKSLITNLRRILPDKKIIWGGVHPTVFSEDAIQYADIICVGEGEIAMAEFLDAISSEKDIYSIRNLWFRVNDKIVKNTNRPIMTNQELDVLPYMDYGLKDSYILDSHRIIPISKEHYLSYCGTNYNTIYSLGCPFSCSYCSNSVFTSLDKGYGRIRKPAVDHIIGEIIDVRKRFPHIRTIYFMDDAFTFMKLEDMREFAVSYREEIALPFAVQWNPESVSEDKLKALIEAGLNRVSMGIQSGSPRTLNLYNRKTPLSSIINASKLFSRYKKFLLLPFYHIILDNPYETKEDILQTIDMLDNLYPPFTLQLYSLQFLPGTKLAEKALEEGVCDINKETHKNYKIIRPIYSNLIISLYGIFKIPHKLLCLLLRSKRMDSGKMYPFIGKIINWFILLRRGVNHLYKNDFSMLPGRNFYLISQVLEKMKGIKKILWIANQ